MADEPITQAEPSETEVRIKDLSSKVKKASEERDEAKSQAEEKDRKIAELEKENSFNASFSDVLSANPNAKDHKDDIKSKVMGGYTVEDATFAVLGKAGKLGIPAPEPKSPAGGSADSTVTGNAGKTFAELSHEDKRKALVEMQGKGDISMT